jgi:hypothetical protein
MKNIKTIFAALLMLSLVMMNTSCKDDVEAGGTAMEKMAGEWVCYSPDFDYDFICRTSNTSSNEVGKLLITDAGGFWDYAVIANADLSSKTFSIVEAINKVVDYDIKISIIDGKITEKAVTLPSGNKADKIEYGIWFEDIADAGAPADYVVTIVGYRYSGFLEDEGYVYVGEEDE